jgi:hypothetical protein
VSPKECSHNFALYGTPVLLLKDARPSARSFSELNLTRSMRALAGTAAFADRIQLGTDLMALCPPNNNSLREGLAADGRPGHARRGGCIRG